MKHTTVDVIISMESGYPMILDVIDTDDPNYSEKAMEELKLHYSDLSLHTGISLSIDERNIPPEGLLTKRIGSKWRYIPRSGTEYWGCKCEIIANYGMKSEMDYMVRFVDGFVREVVESELQLTGYCSANHK